MSGAVLVCYIVCVSGVQTSYEGPPAALYFGGNKFMCQIMRMHNNGHKGILKKKKDQHC